MTDNVEEPITVKKVKKTKEAFAEEPEDNSSEENDSNEENEDEDFEFDMEDMNLGSILQNFLTNEEGTNVCDVLSDLKKSLDTQNKILMKLVNHLMEKGKSR